MGRIGSRRPRWREQRAAAPFGIDAGSFTICQFFQKLHAADVLKSSGASRRFGQALVWLGITMLIVGIAYHVRFMVGLRHQRDQMKTVNLIHADSGFPVSMTLVVAVLLLAVGLLAVFGMSFNTWPFGD
jgi:putative membrane protein